MKTFSLLPALFGAFMTGFSTLALAYACSSKSTGMNVGVCAFMALFNAAMTYQQYRVFKRDFKE